MKKQEVLSSVSNARILEKIKVKKYNVPQRPPISLSKPVPDDITCFCAATVYRIQKGILECAYIPYRRNGIGSGVIKLAGGMGKKSESPLGIVAREIREELGLEIDEKDFQFCFTTSPQSDSKHVKIFLVVTTEIKKPLRNTPYDAETGVPQWAAPEWLGKSLFGVHKEAFPKAIDFLLRHFLEHKNLEGLLAAVNSRMLSLDNKIRGLLFQGSLHDQDFALAHADTLLALGVDKI